jgi:hypothetical protein
MGRIAGRMLKKLNDGSWHAFAEALVAEIGGIPPTTNW